MSLDFDDEVTRTLRQYARSVTDALGLNGECSCVLGEAPASLYLALDGHLARFPEHDVALLWDGRHGWSAAIEPRGGGDLVVVADFDGPVFAPPLAVAQWVAALFRRRAGQLLRIA
jgi:hypothetical protein